MKRLFLGFVYNDGFRQKVREKIERISLKRRDFAKECLKYLYSLQKYLKEFVFDDESAVDFI